MTCAEVMVRVNLDPQDQTTAEVGAVLRHLFICPECLGEVYAVSAKVEGKMTMEQRVDYDSQALDAIVRVLSDPEALS